MLRARIRDTRTQAGKKQIRTKLKMQTGQPSWRLPRLGFPVVASNASEKYIKEGGKKTNPNHWIRSQKSDF